MEFPTFKPSLTEIEATRANLDKNQRYDLRPLSKSREFQSQRLSSPGFAVCSIGRTCVSAHVSADAVSPYPDRPGQGSLQIFVSGPTTHYKRLISDIQSYVRYLWRSSGVLDESVLCIRPGEKVWALSAQVAIHDADGSLIDAIFSALVLALETLRFPAYDASTGAFFSPSVRRPYELSIAFRPICVTLAFYKNEVVVDPTFLESEVCCSTSVFIFDDHDEQVILDAKLPGNIEAARAAAIAVADERRKIIMELVEGYSPEMVSVGGEECFNDFKAPELEMPKDQKPISFSRFEYWKGSTEPEITIDFPIVTEPMKQTSGVAPGGKKGGEEWLFSSISK